MVRVLEEEKEHLRAKLGQFKGMFDGIRQTKSLVIETNGPSTADDRLSKSQASSPLPEPPEPQPVEQPVPAAATAIERTETVKPSRPPASDAPAPAPAPAPAAAPAPAPAPQPRGPPSGKDSIFPHTTFIYSLLNWLRIYMKCTTLPISSSQVYKL